ncbi:MAG: DUF1826 domain-containing protein [Polyangiales bacterium]
MSAPAEAAGLARSSLRFVDDVADLVSVFDDGVSVVTLSRPVVPALAEEASRFASLAAVPKRLFVRTDAGTLPCVGDALLDAPHLRAEILFASELLRDVTGCEEVGVRIAQLDRAMCPRFHVDRVTLRVVCTMAGCGTQFVSNDDVDRSRLGHAASDTTDEASGLLCVSGCIRHAQPFDLVFLKGEAWTDNAGRGAVHRSPAVHAVSPRVVMTLVLFELGRWVHAAGALA